MALDDKSHPREGSRRIAPSAATPRRIERGNSDGNGKGTDEVRGPSGDARPNPFSWAIAELQGDMELPPEPPPVETPVSSALPGFDRAGLDEPTPSQVRSESALFLKRRPATESSRV